MPMTGFFCQDEYLAKTAKLTDEEIGKLFRALMNYHANGVVTDLDIRAGIAFDFIREDIDKAEDAYAKKCKQASENRRKGIISDVTDDNARQRPSTSVNGSDHNNINKRDIKDNKKDISERFERFWSVYPRHIAKQNAKKSFDKLNPDDELLAVMIRAVNEQKKTDQWTKDNGQFIPHPATWINQKRWEDESVPAKPAVVKVLPAQSYGQRDYSSEQEEALHRMLELG
jgi:hypothetical protein